MRITSVIFLLLLICSTAFAADENPVIDANGNPIGPASRHIELSYEFTIRDVPDFESSLRAWAPIPVTGEFQDFKSIDVLGDYDYTIVRERQNNNYFLIFSFTKDDINSSGEIPVRVDYRINRLAYRMDDVLEDLGELDDFLRERYLSADRLVPIDGPIREEAKKLVCGCCSPPIESARAVYDHIVDTMTYDKSGEGWGQGDALFACDIRKGNCTDFHSLFIAEARVLGVPAKFIMGIQIPEDRTSGEITGYHCWAEFFIDDRGWVPVDASEANKHPERKDAYFAGLDANRIQFTMGRDIQLPRSAADPLNFSFRPHVEIDGSEYSDVELKLSFRDI